MARRYFRVGTFNVFNLVRPGVGYYNRPPYPADVFDTKTSWIGSMLDQMDAEIVGFQEVFHRDALQAALDKSGKLRGVTPIVLASNEEENPAFTPAVALATSFDVTSTESIREFPAAATIQLLDPTDMQVVEPGRVALNVALESTVAGTINIPIRSFSRPVLKVGINIAGRFATNVYVCHLKSKRPEYFTDESDKDPLTRAVAAARSLIRRAAEAAALRALVLADIQATNQPVIVLGDVNDSAHAVTTQMISGEKPYYRLSRRFKEPYWDVLLYTAQEILLEHSTRDTYFTHIHDGAYEALDQIMVSQEYYGRNPDAIAALDFVRVFNDHLIDEAASFESTPVTRSDHGLVVARFAYDDAA